MLGVKGSVRAYTYDNGDHDGSVITTLNKTQEGHPFHDGWVSRDWFRGKDGATWVATTGGGANKDALRAGFNQFVGGPIFDFFDAEAKAYAIDKICGRR